MLRSIKARTRLIKKKFQKLIKYVMSYYKNIKCKDIVFFLTRIIHHHNYFIISLKMDSIVAVLFK